MENKINWNDKEQVKIYQKEYRERNKEILDDKMKRKVVCPICGAHVQSYYLKKHMKKPICKKKLMTQYVE